jgi:hypothetical protein
MTVGIQLGNITDEIGTSDFFHAFFSTISANLEPDGWGSRFPVIMKRLYSGEVAGSEAANAILELATIRSALAKIHPDKVVWDIEDRSKHAPWGNRISSDITNLSSYFVTSTGRDLIGVLDEIFEELNSRGGVARVVTI